MKSYGEYCPIAMGAELVGDRWTPLVLRELMIGSRRFSDIHRGIPRMSRTLLSQRLRQLERAGIVARVPDGYELAEAGRELEPIVWALGDWSQKWFFGDPGQEHLDGTHLMWRVRQRIDEAALPPGRTVVQFDFVGARKGKRIWLLLDPEAGPSVCERDEGFEPDLFVRADILEMHRIWSGRSTWRAAQAAGLIELTGPRPLVRAFPSWFLLSPFVDRAAVGS